MKVEKALAALLASIVMFRDLPCSLLFRSVAAKDFFLNFPYLLIGKLTFFLGGEGDAYFY